MILVQARFVTAPRFLQVLRPHISPVQRVEWSSSLEKGPFFSIYISIDAYTFLSHQY